VVLVVGVAEEHQVARLRIAALVDMSVPLSVAKDRLRAAVALPRIGHQIDSGVLVNRSDEPRTVIGVVFAVHRDLAGSEKPARQGDHLEARGGRLTLPLRLDRVDRRVAHIRGSGASGEGESDQQGCRLVAQARRDRTRSLGQVKISFEYAHGTLWRSQPLSNERKATHSWD